LSAGPELEGGVVVVSLYKDARIGLVSENEPLVA
jgi:hypothetical protein